MSRIVPITAIRSLLVTSTAVSTIIGNRCAPIAQSQPTRKPYITLSTISADHQHHLQAASGLVFQRIQVDCWCEDPDTLRDLADAVRNRLFGYRGTVTVPASQTEAQGTLDIDAIILVDEDDGCDPPTDGKDFGVFRHRLDFRVSAAEPIPSLT